MKKIVVAMTGASGSVYGLRVCSALLRAGCTVSLTLTRAGLAVLAEETGIDWGGPEPVPGAVQAHFAGTGGTLLVHRADDVAAPFASGSSRYDAMVVVPCSMGTLARIASGHSGNAVERAADVMLKERRQLVLVPRETPLGRIHLENMLRVTDAGGIILPAMPGFYHHPQTVDDLVDFVAGKVLDVLGIPNDLYRRWEGA